jgi:hypothetical protein
MLAQARAHWRQLSHVPQGCPKPGKAKIVARRATYCPAKQKRTNRKQIKYIRTNRKQLGYNFFSIKKKTV